MKNTMKRFVTLIMVFCLTVSSSIISFAGEWQKHPDYDSLWVYKNDDGTYAEDCWETIDGKSYHFDTSGILDTDCITEDGYHVDENGVWIESIPQMTQEEMDNYYNQMVMDGLIAQYQVGEEIDEILYIAKAYFGEEQGQEIMDYIQSNYEYGIYNLGY